MSYKGKYILAAIDGTDSVPHRQNHDSTDQIYQIFDDLANTYYGIPKKYQRRQPHQTVIARFYRDFNTNGGIKNFYDGPGETFSGKLLGHGSSATIQEVVRFVNKWAKFYDERGEDYRVCLAGYSRGGMIAISAARMIKTKVYFMALYDAVDRTIGQDTETIENVEYALHAKKHPKMGSRNSFGHTGIRINGGWYDQRFFRTSHGGIGGDLDIHPDHDSVFPPPDLSCSADTLSANITRSLIGTDIAQTCINESIAADQWIRNTAKELDIRFN